MSSYAQADPDEIADSLGTTYRAFIYAVGVFFFIALMIIMIWISIMILTTREFIRKSHGIRRSNFRWFSRVAISALVLSVAWAMLMLVALDYISIILGVFIAIIILLPWWFLIVPLPVTKYQLTEPASGRERLRKMILDIPLKAAHRPVLFWMGTLIIPIVVFVIAFFTWGTCVTLYPIEISTRFSRHFMDPICAGTSPCFVYLTYPEDPTTSVIVNFQIANGIPPGAVPPIVYYDNISHNALGLFPDNPYRFQCTGRAYLYHTVDIERGIFYVQLTNLNPNTVYFFRAGYGNQQEHYSQEISFRTLPNTGPISFVAGGDNSVNPVASGFNAVALSQNPAFALIGGDIAYDNSLSSCYRRWDQFLMDWGQMNTQEGLRVPMILAIGNHEAGGYHRSLSQDGLVDPFQRSTYHSHKLRNDSVLFVLDTEVVASASSQAQWLRNEILTKYTNFPWKMSLFHNPMYPLVTPYGTGISKDIREAWLPVFDQFGMRIAFQNHDHAYMRSKLLKNNAQNSVGTLYIGNGAWGVTPLKKRASNPSWYIQDYQERNFVLRCDLGNQTTLVSALAVSGNVFDQGSVSVL